MRTIRTMHTLVGGFIAVVLSASSPAVAQAHHHADEPPAHAAAAPLFEGLGDHPFAISTTSAEAQRYFDQGLILTYGFDHHEAVRSFEEAARLDPECAMCFWGVALALGPHINAPMSPDAVGPAYDAVSRAAALAPSATPRERAYIDALQARYAPDADPDRAALDRAYADAMRELATAFPDDLDAATLFAESLMNLVPWNYWDEDGRPREETAELTATLERVLERDPFHPGATHLYIHAMEDSPYPERAEEAADNLRSLGLRIGHMIHMPSHIYARVGRWHDASVANEGALEQDAAYFGEHEPEGMVPLLYHPHNFHFLAWTAAMEGRFEVAHRAALGLVDATPAGFASELPFYNSFLATPLLTLVRFERWDDVLAAARPDGDATFASAIAEYAHGLAHAARGDAAAAREHADRLHGAAADPEVAALEIPEVFFPGASILTVASHLLQAEVALLEGRDGDALESFDRAVALQDELPYFEPPHWMHSARLPYGRALLDMERYEDAERVYREDLEAYPNNGWALHGLAVSLEAQERHADAAVATRAFQEAWQQADVRLENGRVAD